MAAAEPAAHRGTSFPAAGDANDIPCNHRSRLAQGDRASAGNVRRPSCPTRSAAHRRSGHPRRRGRRRATPLPHLRRGTGLEECRRAGRDRLPVVRGGQRAAVSPALPRAAAERDRPARILLGRIPGTILVARSDHPDRECGRHATGRPRRAVSDVAEGVLPHLSGDRAGFSSADGASLKFVVCFLIRSPARKCGGRCVPAKTTRGFVSAHNPPHLRAGLRRGIENSAPFPRDPSVFSRAAHSPFHAFSPTIFRLDWPLHDREKKLS